MRVLAVALALVAASCAPILATSDGGTSDDGGSTGDGGTLDDGGTVVAPTACFAGAEITDLPACTGSTSTHVDVPKGCAPTVDGTLRAGEWSDTACFEIAGDLTARVKYAGDAVYLAMSGMPRCGCQFPTAFDPDGAAHADGDEFAVTVSDAPFGADGDRAGLLLRNSAWAAGAVPTSIDVLCPGSQPNPMRFEWRIPFADLGIRAGSAHAFHLAISHAGVSFPEALPLDADGRPSSDTAAWGTFSSSANWK